MTELTHEAVSCPHAEHIVVEAGRWARVGCARCDTWLTGTVPIARPAKPAHRHKAGTDSDCSACQEVALRETQAAYRTRPDGSDLPGEIEHAVNRALLAVPARAGEHGGDIEVAVKRMATLIDKLSNQRVRWKERAGEEYDRGRAEERAAIVAGVEEIAQEYRAAAGKAWSRDAGTHSQDDIAEDMDELIARLQAGEWSAKP